ncbi:hypothetical protein ABPG75_006179 [Micractinium tetrahymenae]
MVAPAQLHRLLSFDIGGVDPADGVQGRAAAAAEAAAAAAAAATHGFDVLVRIVQAHGLAAADWWNGKSDPYCVLRLQAPGGEEVLQYKTRTMFKDLNPQYDEFFEVGNLQAGTALAAEVWDKDILTPDDVLGRAEWVFAPGPGAPAHALSLRLPLEHPCRRQRKAGQLELEVHYRPSEQPGAFRMLGPVRFRQQLSPVSGWLMGHWTDERTLAFSTYKLFLPRAAEIFEGVACPWNRSHAAAAHIFKTPVMLSGVRSQHAALYATQLGRSRAGVLRSAADLFALFGFGLRDGQRRYFTYSLLPDSFRCSETGAKFFADYFSKHAMHSGGSEEVLYAGEFCIMPDEAAPGGHKLVIDNNSGTYAPPARYLPLMAQLFSSNFPDLAVETVGVGDPRLEHYHKLCPSRLKAAQAAAAQAAAAEVAAEAAAAESAAPP